MIPRRCLWLAQESGVFSRLVKLHKFFRQISSYHILDSIPVYWYTVTIEITAGFQFVRKEVEE